MTVFTYSLKNQGPIGLDNLLLSPGKAGKKYSVSARLSESSTDSDEIERLLDEREALLAVGLKLGLPLLLFAPDRFLSRLRINRSTHQ